MREVNSLPFSHICQTSVKSIGQIVCTQVVRRIKPFFFEFSPQCLGNVQMRRIGRQKGQIQPPVLPIGYSFFYSLCFVYACIVQHDKCFLLYLKREFFKKLQNKLRINVLFGHFPLAFTLSVYQTKAVEFVRFFRKEAYLFIGKLPAVRHIAFATYMCLVPVIKLYPAFNAQLFKFLQFFHLKSVMLRQGLSFRTASYSLIFSASVFKKALKVVSHTFFPLCASHSALAVRIRCLFALIAVRIAGLSSTSEIIALRPRPGFVCRPEMPSVLYRFTQLFTLTSRIPVIAPTSLELRPSDFNNTLWQRMRKQCLEPCLTPCSSSWRCSVVSIGVFTRPIVGTKIQNNLN